VRYSSISASIMGVDYRVKFYLNDISRVWNAIVVVSPS